MPLTRGTCEIEGCGRPHCARGLCHTHYAAWRREGKKAEVREARVAQPTSCRQCGKPIPLNRTAKAVFCSPQCKRRDQYNRERVDPPRRTKPCSVEGCGSVVLARDLCSMHYTRWRSKGDLGAGRKNARGTCTVEGCSRAHVARGLCELHRDRERRERERQERLAARGDRTCLTCGTPLALERRANSMFCSTECKTKERIASGRAAEAATRHYFRSQYGLTREQIDVMLAGQDGGCAICQTKDPGGRHGAFHVDHDHKTDAVRGILCHSCNVGVGYFKDDPALLRAAAEYLERAAALT